MPFGGGRTIDRNSEQRMDRGPGPHGREYGKMHCNEVPLPSLPICSHLFLVRHPGDADSRRFSRSVMDSCLRTAPSSLPPGHGIVTGSRIGVVSEPITFLQVVLAYISDYPHDSLPRPKKEHELQVKFHLKLPHSESPLSEVRFAANQLALSCVASVDPWKAMLTRDGTQPRRSSASRFCSLKSLRGVHILGEQPPDVL
jgi:hypothetical protein